MVTILSRSRWTSTSARGSAINWSRVRGIVCHYPAMGRSVGVLTQAQEAARLRGWRSYHVNSLGWKDIGYSYGIGQSGRIYSLRGDRVGGHTFGHNSTTLGVLFIVGDNEPLTAAAKASFRALRATLRKRGASSGVWGHQEMSGNSTRCPGPYIMGSIRNGELTGASGGTTAPKPGTSKPTPDSSRPWRTSPRVNGMSTAEVKRIQTELVGADYSIGSYGIDGSYGDGTGNAVKQLQTDLGLTADGVWGPATQEALMSLKSDVDFIRRVTVENQKRIGEARSELDWVRRVVEVNQKRIGYVDAKVSHINRDGTPVSLRQEVADSKTFAMANAAQIKNISTLLAEANVDATEAKVSDEPEG